MKKYTDGLIEFIKKSPTAYHAVNTAKERLISSGNIELSESEPWSLSDGGKYFVVKNGTSIIASDITRMRLDSSSQLRTATHPPFA